MENINEFKNTYNFFKYTFDSFNISFPIPYEVWQTIPSELQSAALFCNFYNQINLVWLKVKTPASVSADCVSEVLVYLQKNVEKILSDQKRYTPSYIYRVAYNCMFYTANYPYTKTSGVNGYYQNTVPHIVKTDNGEIDLYDMICGSDSDLTETELMYEYSNLWEIIDSLDENHKKVVYGIIDGKKQIGLTTREKHKIMNDLKKLLKDFA